MSDDKDYKTAAQFLVKMMETQGVSCSTMENGHLLMFKRAWLQNLLDSHPNNESLSIFIERLDFKKAN